MYHHHLEGIINISQRARSSLHDQHRALCIDRAMNSANLPASSNLNDEIESHQQNPQSQLVLAVFSLRQNDTHPKTFNKHIY
jgi:hypothetical protein